MGRKQWILLITAILILAIVGFSAYKLVFSQPGPASLQVTSTPKANVFINDKLISQTPYYAEKIKPEEIVIKVVPLQMDAAWAGKQKLNPGTWTFVNVFFDQNQQATAEILSMEKIDSRKAEMTIMSEPTGSVKVDGVAATGTTPLQMSGITLGDHAIEISAEGFQTRKSQVRAVSGYKTILNTELVALSKTEAVATAPAVVKESTPSAKTNSTEKISPAPSTENKLPYAEILETPTGWLRVRQEASLNATEAARIKPGEKYPYLEEKTGWVKIEYEKDKTGWVSSQYVKVVKQ